MAEEKWDDLFPDAKQQKADIEEKGLLFAQRYLVFGGPTSDPRARDLLEHWTRLARRKRIPAGASAQEYAAANAFRELIEGIHAQIEFAMNGQNVPKPRTTK
ncbi:MAG: hypothetical protein KGL39_07320 [Patescibacteria group bacterium]|nr:hypothetical protein [Patescibacteria group bacterium]